MARDKWCFWGSPMLTPGVASGPQSSQSSQAQGSTPKWAPWGPQHLAGHCDTALVAVTNFIQNLSRNAPLTVINKRRQIENLKFVIGCYMMPSSIFLSTNHSSLSLMFQGSWPQAFATGRIKSQGHINVPTWTYRSMYQTRCFLQAAQAGQGAESSKSGILHIFTTHIYIILHHFIEYGFFDFCEAHEPSMNHPISAPRLDTSADTLATAPCWTKKGESTATSLRFGPLHGSWQGPVTVQSAENGKVSRAFFMHLMHFWCTWCICFLYFLIAFLNSAMSQVWM